MPTINSRFKKGGAVALLAIATIGGFEGMRTRAYLPLPNDVPTICFGSTKGVKLGDVKTVEECKDILLSDIQEHERGMRACLKAPDALSDRTYVAFTSTAFNIGIGAFCGGSIARKINAGDVRGACNAILLYDKFKGKALPGLTRRRKQEQALCLEGV